MSRPAAATPSEFLEAPAAVRRQTEALARPLAELVGLLRERTPQVVLTCARGSSAHAATFGKHLIERHLGIPVAAMAPNIATIYRRKLALDGQLFLAISQSGRSDDLVESARMARRAGALAAAIVNDVDSPLAGACDIVLPTAAGPESGVTATKTFVATLSALLRVVAAWADDEALARAIERLPDRLSSAGGLDWSAGLRTLAGAASLVTLGRGPTLAIAREAALKLKEGCDLHAEAFSGAEFLHGPVALVSPRYPIMIFMPTDAAAAGLRELAASLCCKKAIVLLAGGSGDAAIGMPAVGADHPDTDALCLVQSFYHFLVQLAGRRGTDLRAPRHLQKVTRTR
jgi:glucosamine--fructose-6-phosphate aminotransferase (isomerizing)